MSYVTKIEWTRSTWNPVTGCHKVSAACENCYAERFANRFRGVKGHPYEYGFSVRLWPNRLMLPLKWRKPRDVFVNSMSDLFLNEVPLVFIDRIFDTIQKAYWHNFQILTKRPKRMIQWVYHWLRIRGALPRNVWFGVSVEDSHYKNRIDCLRLVPSNNRFVSFEPLIGNVNLDDSSLADIHWVIVGGETGPRARPMEPEWVDHIFRACCENRIPFFFKQWGEFDSKGRKVGKARSGSRFLSAEWKELPRNQEIAQPV